MGCRGGGSGVGIPLVELKRNHLMFVRYCFHLQDVQEPTRRNFVIVRRTSFSIISICKVRFFSKIFEHPKRAFVSFFIHVEQFGGSRAKNKETLDLIKCKTVRFSEK